jgi:putative ABC transport system permease protein
MRWLQSISHRLRSLFRKDAVEHELSDEMRFHIERQVEENLTAGMSLQEARRAAMREFGGVEQIKEECRDTRRVNFLETLLQDLRYGARMLRKNPGFTTVAVLTLALGIGANTAIFSVTEVVLLRPLPYPHSEQLVMVWENVRLPNYQNDQNPVSPGNFAEWSNQNSIFQGISAYSNRSFSLTGKGDPIRIEGELVTYNFFTVLQVNAALGRGFVPDEDRPGAAHVVVITDGLWRSRFAADVQILGKTILLDGESYIVVGVMPPGFHFPDPDDQLFVPIALSPEERNNRGSHYLDVFARLKPEVTLAQARVEMDMIARHLTELYPLSNTGEAVNVVPLHEEIAGPLRSKLMVLSGAVGMILLIVCANVANLQLARASSRHREVAIRLAIGASRSRILRQLLTESVLLALLGCLLGLMLARWGVTALKFLNAWDIPRMEEIGLNGSVFLFSLGISILAGFAFGVMPALQAARGSASDSLKEGARESAAGGRVRTRSLLVVLEIALGVIVVIGAGLLLRSFLALERVPLGFQPESILTFRVIPRGARYSQPLGRTAFYQQALEKIDTLPGVKSAAAVTFLPLTLFRGSKGFTIEGRAPSAPGQIPMANYDIVTPDYFGTMQIPLLKGRDFSWGDTPQSQQVVIINQAMARKYWPGEDPLGKRFRQGGSTDEFPWMIVVGVVGDIREYNVLTPPRPTVYFPISQLPDPGGLLRDWVVRTDKNPLGLASAIPPAIWSMDKDLPVSRIRTMEQVRTISVAPQWFNLLLFGLFAVLALVLAAIGIYGVMAYSVTQRTREIGVRVALGAQHGDVLRLVLQQGARLAALGVFLGLAGAQVVARLMANLLYGVQPTDPITFAAVALLLAVVALLACYIPARRAMRLDPLIALRYE